MDRDRGQTAEMVEKPPPRASASALVSVSMAAAVGGPGRGALLGLTLSLCSRLQPRVDVMEV
eukprot:CAMPEP_0206026722 /NCGR_PEP_ID=MMETSP1464-20131121/42121_1 /ASSEMBLY_ACC=CAM_ASM_001124 /TAXON_ID=119497 /ORGANISM="Exanthemachrysis gayraliae, Strain RCC1523" /LENGTH=61 /DNA_ID=CAMNT_0053400765 /DNA_START=63 /DNA_END=248 /DNA_ORIENTATION=+